MGSSCVFFNERLNNSQLILGTYPNDNDELTIVKIGSMTSGSTFFSSLDGIGCNIYVVGLADFTIVYNSSSPKVENEWNCSSGDV